MSEPIPLLSPRDGLPDITHDDIAAATASLVSGYGAFAVDTERAQGIRYSDRAYLVQIRRPGAGTFLIDPIGIEDRLSPLADAMKAEWILHDASQDLHAMHDLGFYPSKVFDTHIAALLLGYEHVSLQAIAADITGYALAKEFSNSDWSQRPLNADLRTYAALDVELLHELKETMTELLERAGRLVWCEQECEAIRLKPKPEPKKQPWRKIARQLGIKDQRSLAMLQELWNERDRLAKKRDVAPSRVIPHEILGQLALHKPRSRADVLRSSLMRSHVRRKDADHWWAAINRAWRLRDDDLPERRFKEKEEIFPPVKRWENSHPEEALRWHRIRGAALMWSQELGIRQELLLKPSLQKRLAWEGWIDPDDFSAKLDSWGARPWQIEQIWQAILHY